MADENIQTEAAAENSTIKALREARDVQEKGRKEAEAKVADFEAKLLEIERSKLDEVERLRAEKTDLENKYKELSPAADALGKYESKFQSMYEAELAKVPADKLAHVQSLVGEGSYADRLDKINAALALTASAPKAAGTVTNPAVPQPVPNFTPAPEIALDPKDWGKVDFRKVIDFTKRAGEQSPSKKSQE